MHVVVASLAVMICILAYEFLQKFKEIKSALPGYGGGNVNRHALVQKSIPSRDCATSCC